MSRNREYNNPRWKGGISEGYILKLCKNLKIIEICEMCNKKNCKLEYHHKDKDRLNNSRYNVSLLCASCHAKTHNRIKNIPKSSMGIYERKYIRLRNSNGRFI